MPTVTKTLCLMRHGKSSWDDSTQSDRERPLNERGERDVPIIARRLKESGIRPSLIMASNALRAWSTAISLADGVGYPREFLQREALLYLADTATIRLVVSQQDDRFQCIVACGHNPGMTTLANELIPRLTDNLPTSGIVCVQAETERWVDFFDAPLQLLRYDTPKQPWRDDIVGS